MAESTFTSELKIRDACFGAHGQYLFRVPTLGLHHARETHMPCDPWMSWAGARSTQKADPAKVRWWYHPDWQCVFAGHTPPLILAFEREKLIDCGPVSSVQLTVIDKVLTNASAKKFHVPAGVPREHMTTLTKFVLEGLCEVAVTVRPDETFYVSNS